MESLHIQVRNDGKVRVSLTTNVHGFYGKPVDLGLIDSHTTAAAVYASSDLSNISAVFIRVYKKGEGWISALGDTQGEDVFPFGTEFFEECGGISK